jgi:hypothetical protein
VNKGKSGYNNSKTDSEVFYIWKEINRMEVAAKKIYAETLEQQQIEVRQSVIDGLRQTREGKTKDFNTVCDRLEKKYTNAKV